jgi:hypothetical protein
MTAVAVSSASAEQTFILRDRDDDDDMISVGSEQAVTFTIVSLQYMSENPHTEYPRLVILLQTSTETRRGDEWSDTASDCVASKEGSSALIQTVIDV